MALTKAVCILLQSFKNYFCVEFCLIVRFFFLNFIVFIKMMPICYSLVVPYLAKKGKHTK